MNAPVLMFVLPLLAAFLLSVISRVSQTAARWTGPLVLGLNVLLGLQAWFSHPDTVQVTALAGFGPPLGIVFYSDPVALLFAVATSLGVLLLWPARGSGDAYLRSATLALVLTSAGTGLALSGDLFNLYVFYELAAVASYGLAAAAGSAAAAAATLRYVVISSFGAALMLAGIALVYMATGTLNIAQLATLTPELAGPQGLTAFVFILIGAGVKAELFPVNTWVPEVYGATTKRVAALLAGIISKLALLIIVRLLVLVFYQPEALQIMLLLGTLGIVTGELAAWRAGDVTRMLACSSIGQLGMMFVAFSVPGVPGLYAGLAVMLHHMLVKPALFLLAERWGRSIDGLAGAAQASPLAAGVFVLLALSLIGVPPLPGFWAKLLVLTAAFSQQAAAYHFAAGVVLLAAVIEAVYLMRVITRLYSRVPAAFVGAAPARASVAVSTLLSAVLVAALLWLAPLGSFLQSSAGQLADREAYVRSVYPHEVMP